MSRLFIADSEDEEGDNSPASPGPVALPPLGTGQSSDPLSRGTDSTDTAFFKNVYHEQTEAIHEHTRAVLDEAPPAASKRVSGGGGMWDVPSSPDPQPASSRKKRRKLSNDRKSSPESGDDHLNGDVSSMMPPTLQIDNEAAFVVTPNTVPKSRREEDEAIDYGSSVDREPISTLQAHGQRLLDLTSSSSGTNLNTPRTAGALTQLANTQDFPPTAPYEDRLPSPTMQASVSRTRRFSSPDVIAADVVTDIDDQYHEPTGDDEDIRAAAFSAHEDALEEKQEPIIIEDDDDDESSFEEEPIKPKKKRGRPKKSKLEATSTLPVKDVPATGAAAAKTTKEKKKRGRPRKNQKGPEKAMETTIVESPATVDETELPNVAKASVHQVEGDELDSRPEGAEVPEPLDNGNAKEEPDQRTPKLVDETPQASKAIGEANSKTEGGKHQQIGVKDEGKPVFRVGLSKRTRIAPLLKVIRK